ncbi:MAG TPA: ABC transporter permease, partial [Planctomycetaceae bacterium]|nr:ABC transporter permease [Planctomycetaceae bacterium]
MTGPGSFELFVAGRYLRARRREKVISVITVISVIGVAAGVMALVISLAVNNGFRDTLQRNLLGATAHVNIMAKDPGQGIADWPALSAKLQKLPHVIAVAPVLYDQVFVTGPLGGKGIVLKGINVKDELATSDTLRHLKAGSLSGLDRTGTGLPGIVLGARLAQDTGLMLDSVVTVISPQGTLTPFGPQPRSQRFRVVGIFESGFFDVDDSWAYASLGDVQHLLSVNDVVNAIELRLDNLYLAPEVAKDAERAAGSQYTSTNWEEQNAQLLHALKMERAVTAITIGLIEIVAALNILITLTMIVLTKYKDIAVLLSMGARPRQIRRIFVLQGAIIGVIGTGIGLTVGYTLCYFADKYRWIRLDESIYALSFVPFEPRPLDGLWIAGAALLVS